MIAPLVGLGGPQKSGQEQDQTHEGETAKSFASLTNQPQEPELKGDSPMTDIDDLWIDIQPYRPSLYERVQQRVREWWCDRFGHDYYGGSGFNGEYTQHWYQCRRCGDGGSD